MALSDETIKKALDLLKALDDAVTHGPWEESLFLRGIGKNLQNVRNQYVHDLGLEEFLKESTNSTVVDSSLESAGEFAEVYISLYQAEGANMSKWAVIVSSLAQISISRPIYKNEIDIDATIRSKAYKVNDAYVVVKVRNTDIITPPEGKVPVNRYGRELLILRENAVRPENVTRFVHVSGQYYFANGILHKNPAK